MTSVLPKPSLWAILLMVGVGIVFYGIGLGLIALAAWNGYRSTVAAGWPVVRGELQEVRLVHERHRRGSTDTVKVLYAYAVGGTEYTGTTIAFGYRGSSESGPEKKIHDRLKNARVVDVRYNPADPADSCLSCGWHRSLRALAVFGATWLAFLIGFTAVVILSGKRDSIVLRNLVTYQISPSPNSSLG